MPTPTARLDFQYVRRLLHGIQPMVVLWEQGGRGMRPIAGSQELADLAQVIAHPEFPEAARASTSEIYSFPFPLFHRAARFLHADAPDGKPDMGVEVWPPALKRRARSVLRHLGLTHTHPGVRLKSLTDYCGSYPVLGPPANPAHAPKGLWALGRVLADPSADIRREVGYLLDEAPMERAKAGGALFAHLRHEVDAETVREMATRLAGFSTGPLTPRRVGALRAAIDRFWDDLPTLQALLDQLPAQASGAAQRLQVALVRRALAVEPWDDHPLDGPTHGPRAARVSGPVNRTALLVQSCSLALPERERLALWWRATTHPSHAVQEVATRLLLEALGGGAVLPDVEDSALALRLVEVAGRLESPLRFAQSRRSYCLHAYQDLLIRTLARQPAQLAEYATLLPAPLLTRALDSLVAPLARLEDMHRQAFQDALPALLARHAHCVPERAVFLLLADRSASARFVGVQLAGQVGGEAIAGEVGP